MAVPRDCLPAEVWLNVFDHIQDKKQLAQCKLVCKRWAPLAEMAMLKTVVLPRNSTRKLYQHLLKNPRSSQYIQVVDIPNYTSEDLSNIRNVLTMAMTPSPKEIGADILAKEILGIVVDIAAQMPSDNLKLERMPIVTFENDAYAALVYQLRKTLRSLSLAFLPESRLDSIRRIFCNLGHFQSLTTLSLFDRKVYLDSVSMVDDLLKGCPHLKTLSLGIDMSTRRKAHHQGNLDAWLLKNVQQVHCMKEVSLQNMYIGSDVVQDANNFGLFLIDLLQYLSFKYPKVERFYMSEYKQRNQPILQSIFESAKTIHLRDLIIDNFDHLKQIIDA